ncbi:MAG TPA: pentapeptide repeat-containing protein [Ktedonobacteraceae bacterium]
MGDHTQEMLTTHTNNIADMVQEDQSINLQESPFLPRPQGAKANDCDLWRDYWRTRNQPWRTEPEIDVKRRAILNQYHTTIADSERGCYPFKDIGSKLSRADVEWLLASQVDGNVDWSNVHQRECAGLDLRGADLRKVRLSGLPLTHMRGGLIADEWVLATDQQRAIAGAHLEGADLRGARLEGADLCGAHLAGADLRGVHLEGANLCGAHLEGTEEFPNPADLRMSFFNSTTILEGITLGDETYGFVPLADVNWGKVNLTRVDWSQVPRLGDEYATQWKLPIEYQGAIRANRQLATELQAQGLNEDAAYFAYRAHVNIRLMRPKQAILPVVLRVFVRERMPLPKVLLRLEERRCGQHISRHPLMSALVKLVPLLFVLTLIGLLNSLALVLLLGLCVVAILAVLPILRKRGPQPPQYRRQHRQVPPPGLLSQEQRRRQQWLLLLGFLLGTPKPGLPLLMGSPTVALQQIPLLRRFSKRWQAHSLPVGILLSFLLLLLLFDDTLVCYGRYIFSLALSLLTGYGYKPARILSWYLVVVFGFAGLYIIFGHLAPFEALIFSLTSFHGRGLFQGNNHYLGDSVAMIAIIEGVIGLFLEICLIATYLWRLVQK